MQAAGGGTDVHQEYGSHPQAVLVVAGDDFFCSELQG